MNGGVALILGKRQIMVVDSTQQIFRGIRAYFYSLRQYAQHKSDILTEILKL